MESQGRFLLRRIAKNIAKDVPGSSDSEIGEYFLEIVGYMPQGGDLREHLLQHQKDYTRYLVKQVRKVAGKQEAEENAGNAGGNAGNVGQQCGQGSGGGGGEVSRAVSSSPERRRASKAWKACIKGMHIIELLQGGRYDSAIGDQINALWKEIEEGVIPSELASVDQHCLLLMMTDGYKDADVFYNVLRHCFTFADKDLKQIRDSSSWKRVPERLQRMEKFLKMSIFRRSRFPQDMPLKWAIVDAFMALFSVFLDLLILSHRQTPFTLEQGKTMGRLATQLMDGAGERAMDAILQITDIGPEDIYIWPLARYVMREKPAPGSCTHYLRYIMTACKCRPLWPQVAHQIEEIRQIQAPPGFLEFVKRWNPAACEEIPSDRKFRGQAVTAYLLDDNDKNTMQAMIKTIVLATHGQATQGVSDQSQSETAQEGRSDSAASAEKAKTKKKKKKQKMSMVNGDREPLPADSEDKALSEDRSGRVEEVMSEDDTAQVHIEVEEFDLTNVADMMASRQEHTGSELFVVDRGEKRSLDKVSSETVGPPKKKKKKSEVTLPEPASETAFFIDRGQKTHKTQAPATEGDKPKKEKKKKKKKKDKAIREKEVEKAVKKKSKKSKESDAGNAKKKKGKKAGGIDIEDAAAIETEEEAVGADCTVSSPGEGARRKEKGPQISQGSPTRRMLQGASVEDTQFSDRGEEAQETLNRPGDGDNALTEIQAVKPTEEADVDSKPSTGKKDAPERNEKVQKAALQSSSLERTSPGLKTVASSREPRADSEPTISANSGLVVSSPSKKRKSRSSSFRGLFSGEETHSAESPSSEQKDMEEGVSDFMSPVTQSVSEMAKAISARLDMSVTSDSTSPLPDLDKGQGLDSRLRVSTDSPLPVSGGTGKQGSETGSSEGQGHCLDDSMVPDSVSDMESEGDVMMVPDLRPYLKTSPPEENAEGRHSEADEELSSSPVFTQKITSAGSTPASETVIAEEGPGQKRRRRTRSVEQKSGEESTSTEKSSEKIGQNSQSLGKEGGRRKSLVEQGNKEEGEISVADTKKSLGKTRRSNSKAEASEDKSCITEAKEKTPVSETSSESASEQVSKRRSSGQEEVSKRRSSGQEEVSKRRSSVQEEVSKRRSSGQEEVSKRRSSGQEEEAKTRGKRKRSESSATPRDESEPRRKTPKSTPQKDSTPKAKTPKSTQDKSTPKEKTPKSTPRDDSAVKEKTPKSTPQDDCTPKAKTPKSTPRDDSAVKEKTPQSTLQDKSTPKAKTPKSTPQDDSTTPKEKTPKSTPRDNSITSKSTQDKSTPKEKTPNSTPQDDSTTLEKTPKSVPCDDSTPKAKTPKSTPQVKPTPKEKTPKSIPRDDSAPKGKTPKITPQDESAPKAKTPKITPQDDTTSKEKTPKSITPVSRRTRSHKNPTKSQKTQETEPGAPQKTSLASTADASDKAVDTETLSPKPGAKEEKEPPVSQPQPETTKTRSLRSKTPTPTKGKSVSETLKKSVGRRVSLPAVPANATSDSSVSKITRRSLGPRVKPSPADSTTEEGQSGKKTGFTKLKPLEEKPEEEEQLSKKTRHLKPLSEKPESSQGEKEKGREGEKKKTRKSESGPSAQKTSSTPLPSASPDVHTRSQSRKKGYNLRQSMKMD